MTTNRRRFFGFLAAAPIGAAMAAKMVEARAMTEQCYGTILSDTISAISQAKLAEAPSPARKVDWDKWAERYGEVSDVDADLFFSEDEVHQHDQIRLQEMQRKEQQAAAPAMAKTAAGVAKDLSQTQLPNGTALDALVGPGAYPAAGGA